MHKLKAIIDITDILDLSIIALPSAYCEKLSDDEEKNEDEDEEEGLHQDYLLQFSLIGIGEKLVFFNQLLLNININIVLLIL